MMDKSPGARVWTAARLVPQGRIPGKGLAKSGEARTLSEVAEREGMDWADVSRMVDLTTLAPGIVAAILDETRPSEVTLVDSHVGGAAVVGGAASAVLP